MVVCSYVGSTSVSHYRYEQHFITQWVY